MNLHGIAAALVAAVNPSVTLIVRVSQGYLTNPDGSRTPQYLPPQTVQGQVQALSYEDIRHLDALNIQGERRAIYISGKVDGLVRAENKGGDLIVMPDGSEWLVAQVLEYWPDWVKVAVTLQRRQYLAPAAGPSSSEGNP